MTHIHDPQIRAELREVVSACKSEKTESVDVFMKIVLTDDTPIFQRSRHLSLPEKQEVDKQNC